MCLLAEPGTFMHLRSNDCTHGMDILGKPVKFRENLGKEILSPAIFMLHCVRLPDLLRMVLWIQLIRTQTPQNFCWCLTCLPSADTQHSPVKSCCWEIMGQVLSSCQSPKFPALQHWLQFLLQNHSILGPMKNSAFISYLPVAASCGSWLLNSVISLESPLDPDWPEGSYTINQPKLKPWIK